MSQPSAASILPPNPNLENYKKQAKDLLNAFEAGEDSALARVKRSHPRYQSVLPTQIKLADAQLVIAREHGAASWPEFKECVISSGLDFHGRVDAMILDALAGRQNQALEMLNAEPALGQANIYAASVMGDDVSVRRFLENEPSLVGTPGGPKACVPLLYSTHSHLLKSKPNRDGLIKCVRLLLDSGADPNSAYREEPFLQYPLSALYGAAGKFNDPELTAILLDHGANPNDNESLYHSVEHGDLTCTRMLFDHGAVIEGTNAFRRVFDFENIEALGLFVERGADPNERDYAGTTPLHSAVLRKRSEEIVGLLLAFGAEIDARSHDGLTPYKLAVRQGDLQMAEFLKSRGSSDTPDDLDRFLSACYRGDREAALDFVRANPLFVEQLAPKDKLWIVDAASAGETKAVEIMLDAGFDIGARKDHNATSLHWTSWNGHPATVRLLIDRGAEISAEGANLGSTPLQWALYGSANNASVQIDNYIAVAKLLIAADRSRKPDMSSASEEMRELLTEWMAGLETIVI